MIVPGWDRMVGAGLIELLLTDDPLKVLFLSSPHVLGGQGTLHGNDQVPWGLMLMTCFTPFGKALRNRSMVTLSRTSMG